MARTENTPKTLTVPYRPGTRPKRPANLATPRHRAALQTTSENQWPIIRKNVERERGSEKHHVFEEHLHIHHLTGTTLIHSIPLWQLDTVALCGSYEHMSISSYSHPARTKVGTGISRACKILASDVRYRIVSTLLEARRVNKELCVNEIAHTVRLSQSATSHQLALLEAYGVVHGMRMGQETCYDLFDSSLTKDIERIIRIGDSA